MRKSTVIFVLFLVAAGCDDSLLEIEQANVQEVALAQNAQLLAVNPQISSEAQQVLNYLEVVVSNNNILAGQHIASTRTDLYASNNEYQHIKNVVGKYPALLGLDWFVSERTDEQAHVLRNAKVQMATEHWNQGGIVTFTWHHEYPGHLNEGFYLVARKATQAEFDQIVTKGTDRYNTWLSEVDLIASYMKQLENAGVPIIFRPYHEMNKDGFWYGGKTPASFIKLWNNLYDRLVNYHGLDNLLWCWSLHAVSVNNNYYPGDDKVDITGVDVYKPIRDNFSYISFDNKLQIIASKPYALAEVGLLPTNEILNSTRYAWFLPWKAGWMDMDFYTSGVWPDGGTLPGNTATELLDVYSNPKVITRDEVNMGSTTPVSTVMAEAEVLPVFDSAHPGVNSSSIMSGGSYSYLKTCVNNDYIEYSVNIPSAGVYPINIGALEGPPRAEWQLSIDGTNQGGVFDGYATSHRSIDLPLGSRSFSAGTHTFRFTTVGINSQATQWNIAFDYIKVGSTKYEVEQLNIYDSAHPRTKNNANMSGGGYSFIENCVVNDFMEYTINVPNTKSYSIKVGSSDSPQRAKWQCSVDGTDVGTPHDAFSTTFHTTVLNMGSKTLSAGEHKLRFTVVGKNPSATDWNIGFDYFELIPTN